MISEIASTRGFSSIRSHLQDSLYLNSYLIMAMRLVASVSGLLFWALAARILAEQDVGLGSSIVAGAMLLAGLSQIGLNYCLVRYLPQSKSPHQLINASAGLVTILSLALSLFFVLTLSFWSPALLPLRARAILLLSFITLIVGTALLQLLNWTFFARRKSIFPLVINTVQSVLAIVLLLLFSRYRHSYESVLYAYSSSMMAGLLLSAIVFLPRSQAGYKLSLTLPTTVRPPFVTYALSSYLADQLQRAPDTIMTLLVVNVLGPKTSAYFFIVWSIAMGLRALVGSLSLSLFTEGANNRDMSAEYARKSLKMGLFYTALITLGMALFHKLILISFGPTYVERGSTLLILLAASIIPNIIVLLYMSLLRIRDRLKSLLSTAALDLILGLLLSYLLMNQLGLIGVGVGWLTSRIIMACYAALMWKWQNLNQLTTPHVKFTHHLCDAHPRSAPHTTHHATCNMQHPSQVEIHTSTQHSTGDNQ
ncbi:MAG: lipopolysaccharide biosynthesis protein [Chloroflexota bacterium]|nr:lipopolysaccharide biosynthesis protein [Chloroflexota bacterium]